MASTAHAFDDENIDEQFAEALREMGRINVLVIGATGVGKSTLINSFFVGNPARTGTGRPVTQDTTCYETPNGLLRIYDTKGVEFGDSRDRIKSWLKKEVRKQRASRDPMHVAWFCVRAGDRRLDDTQLQLIRTLVDAHVPVLLVMTQVHRERNGQVSASTIRFVEAIEDVVDAAGASAIVLTAAQAERPDTPTAHGLDDLLDLTRALVTPDARAALDAVQRVDWAAKRRKGHAAVTSAAAAAAGVAAAPVPLSDSVGIVPIQVAMLARITALYGVPATTKQLAGIVAPIVIGGGVSAAGRLLFRAVLKVIPGANVAVGAAAATVAGTITVALGEAWMLTCEQLARRGSVSDLDFVDLRREFLRNYRSRAKLDKPTAA